MKSENIKIVSENEKLTAMEVESHKDFASVYQRYLAKKKSLIIRKILYASCGFGLAAATGFIYFGNINSPSPVKIQPALSPVGATLPLPAAEAPKTNSFTTSVLNKINLGEKSYLIKADAGAKLTYNNHYNILIPKNCFTTPDGRNFAGWVDIRFGKLSGGEGTSQFTPPQGVKLTDLYYIEGYSEGMPLTIKPGKLIDIVNTSGSGNTENVFSYDTLQMSWQASKKHVTCASFNPALQPYKPDAATQEKLSALNGQLNKTKTEIKNLQTGMPYEPKLADDKKFHVTTEVNPIRYPEFASYGNVSFEVDKNIKDFILTYTWDNISIKKGPDNTYILSLIKGGKSNNFVVTPVFEGDNYKNALKMYTRRMKDYLTVLHNKNAKVDKLKKETANLLQLEKDMETTHEQQQIAALKVTKCTLTVSTFGIWGTGTRSAPSKNTERR